MDKPTFSEYIGVISKPIGLDGTVVLVDTVAVPVELHSGSLVGIGVTREYLKEYTVAFFEATPQRTLLRLKDSSNPADVVELQDQAVYVRADDMRPSARERYAVGDIEGCLVRLDTGTNLGKIVEVMLLPANDVWVVETPQGKQIPLPVIDDVVKNVDILNKIITVSLLPGLEDINSAIE